MWLGQITLPKMDSLVEVGGSAVTVGPPPIRSVGVSVVCVGAKASDQRLLEMRVRRRTRTVLMVTDWT